MLKLLIFLLGLAAGGGGATAWMLSEPGPTEPKLDVAARPVLDRDSLQARLNELRVRFEAALRQGEQAGRETEEQLRRKLAAYRQDPDRSSAA